MIISIEQSIDKIVKDAAFFKSIKDIFSSSELSEPKFIDEMRKASIFMYHLVDYYVSIRLITVDITADLIRLCNDNPVKAKRLISEINRAAIIMRSNYQYLCSNRSERNPYIYPQFFLYTYGFFILKHCGIDTPFTELFPNLGINLNDVELFSSNDDKEFLFQKYLATQGMVLTEINIMEFIDNIGKWADIISDTLDRTKSDMTTLEFDPLKISALHMFCNNGAYYDTDAKSLLDAIMNVKKPSFKIKNKDFFYEIIFALYETSGSVTLRDSWLKSVLSNFDLEISDYSSHISKVSNGVKKGSKEKSVDRYKHLKEILE